MDESTTESGGDDGDEKRFPCPDCDSVFRQNGQLSRHYRRVHEKVSTCVYIMFCLHCVLFLVSAGEEHGF